MCSGHRPPAFGETGIADGRDRYRTFGALGPVSAQQPSQAQIGAIRQACRADYPVHCAGVPPGGAPALACLQKNVAGVSAGGQRRRPGSATDSRARRSSSCRSGRRGSGGAAGCFAGAGRRCTATGQTHQGAAGHDPPGLSGGLSCALRRRDAGARGTAQVPARQRREPVGRVPAGARGGHSGGACQSAAPRPHRSPRRPARRKPRHPSPCRRARNSSSCARHAAPIFAIIAGDCPWAAAASSAACGTTPPTCRPVASARLRRLRGAR